MAHNIRVIGMIIKSMDSELTTGMMDGCSKESGSQTTCMAWVCTHGLTVEAILVSTKVTRSGALVSTSGPMAECTKAAGSMESSMALAFTKKVKAMVVS